MFKTFAFDKALKQSNGIFNTTARSTFARRQKVKDERVFVCAKEKERGRKGVEKEERMRG